MIGLLCFALAVLASPFKSKLRLEAENTVLRHQLIVLRRRLHGRVRFTNNDRWFLIQLYRWFPSILQVLGGPETMDSRGFLRLRQPEILFARAAPRGSFRHKGGGGISFQGTTQRFGRDY
jgi:hypothetical protein